MTKPPNGGLSVWVILKTLKSALIDCFLTILIQKTTPIKWFLSLKRK